MGNFEMIGPIILGIVCIVIGVLNLCGNVSMLHGYHRKRVSAEDMPIFSRLVGTGTIIMGAGIFTAGGLSLFSEALSLPVYHNVGIGILIAALVVGLGFSFYAMIKYNKGIF